MDSAVNKTEKFVGLTVTNHFYEYKKVTADQFRKWLLLNISEFLFL
jgi:hypothetical protein